MVRSARVVIVTFVRATISRLQVKQESANQLQPMRK